ncbi:Predicted dehydrogenase [Bacillus sp. OV322]|uniref:Gfo/Idh/MocA family protein n=1 Tax=Bacillus sp. OV322 TaxID=1882764 RepID=UPI0008E8ACEC|nr:Gfo/Idh/MocA family oxidoreductase [Bacillus sp. OV322]SFC71704.1 Predicted dehydrogenase [Bacillus sp. OV322]
MIRFGIVGTNWITDKFLDAAKSAEDFILTAVYSRTQERADEFARKYRAEHTFTDLADMAKSDVIDAVYIATPNSLHADQATLFMRNKKHVLCEKPIASNALELQNMIETAKQYDVLLMEAMKFSFLPNFKALKQNLHRVGKVRRYFANYCQYSSRYDSYKEGIVLNAFDPAFSNGALMDIGIYCIYPMVALFGRPIQVIANGLLLETGVDGEGSAMFKYSEMDAVIMYSKITDSSLPSEIHGEEGTIIIDRISTQDKIEFHSRSNLKEDISAEQNKHTMFYEIQEFINLIKNGKHESDKNTFENSLITMEILDEIRKQIGVIYPSDK